MVGVTDACAFHEWAGTPALVPYMSDGWGELVTRKGDRTGPMMVSSQWVLDHPLGGKDPAAYPATGPPGSDYDLLVEQLLGDGRRDRVVLGYHDGLLATANPNPHMARQAVRAANDWTVERWLGRDDRLFAHVLVCTALPEEAAAEIRRVGANDRMVAVAIGTNGLARPFGHPVYAPIHEAAAELDLPLVIQAGCDAATDLMTQATTPGPPTTFAELDVLSGQALMNHVASFVMSGAFDLHPNLRVLLVGGGAAWVPWFLWNMDTIYKYMRRHEAPWMRGSPADSFVRQVRLATHALEDPEPDRLAQVLETIPEAESLFVYASGYPNHDWEQPESVAARLPEAWHDRVFRGNAEALFRWPGAGRRETAEALPPEAIRNLDPTPR